MNQDGTSKYNVQLKEKQCVGLEDIVIKKDVLVKIEGQIFWLTENTVVVGLRENLNKIKQDVEVQIYGRSKRS